MSSGLAWVVVGGTGEEVLTMGVGLGVGVGRLPNQSIPDKLREMLSMDGAGDGGGPIW